MKILRLLLFVLSCFVTFACSSAQIDAREGEIVRRRVAPVKVMWIQGDVQNSETLLTSCLGQSATGPVEGQCLMCSHPGSQASVLLDFGKEMHGALSIVTGQYACGKPVRVRIRLGESVGEAMSDVCEDSGATNDHAIRDFEDTVPWLGVREWGNSGFRFARVDLLDIETQLAVKEINAIWICRDLPWDGSFKSDNDRLNRIWATGAYTVQQNMQDFLWDGIKRDRLVWIGDMHPEVMTVNAVFGKQPVVTRSLDFARDNAPLPQMMNSMSAYSLWWIRIQKEWYMYHGDLEYLEAQRDYLKGLVDVLISKIGPDGRDTIRDHFLDWPSRADKNASGAGFHALFLMAMEDAAWLCKELGDVCTESKCVKASEALRAAGPAVAKAFLEEDIPFSDPGRKQAVALMCLADMIPDQTAAERLLDGGARGFSTFYGYYMLEALAKCGRHQEAVQIMEDFWGGMLDLGATTFWEDFDISWMENAARIDEFTPDGKVDVHGTYGGYCYKKYRHSLSHGWASGPTSWLTARILGITPVEPGCRKVSVSPHLGDLTSIVGTLPTPYGPVTVKAEKLKDRISVDVDSPRGVKILKNS